MAKNREISIAFKVYASADELEEADKRLCQDAQKAFATSHSPYSNFKVGAAIKLRSGKIIYGSNQENAAFPSGLCAERVALFNFGANHPGEIIEAIAITAHTENFVIKNPITPCGSCLQVLAEYEMKQQSEIEIVLYCLNGEIWKAKGIKSFLPFMFFENRLNQTDLLK